MSKDIGVVLALPAELKHRIDAIAAQAGIATQTLMLAYVIEGLKRRPASENSMFAILPEKRQPAVVALSELVQAEDAWRGAPDDDPVDPSIDVDAMVADRIAHAESAGLTAPAAEPYEVFAAGPPPSISPTNVRSLRRPPPQFSPAVQPGHLRGI